MKKLLVVLMILALPVAVLAANSVDNCGANSMWNSATAGQSCQMAPGMGQRMITITDYADSASDTVTIVQCAGETCNTDVITASATAVYDTSVVVAGYGNCGTDTVTFTVVDQNGVSLTTVLTEGTDFDAETSNAVTAGNLCTAITADVPGITATLSTATCIITKVDTYRSVSVASSDATCATTTNTTDSTFACTGSNQNCARSLNKRLSNLLGAGTLSGFSVSCADSICSDSKIGLIPSTGTTELEVTIANSANDVFATMTRGADGTVVVRNLSTLYGEIRFCGNGANATTENYIGPILLSDYENAGAAVEDDFVFGGTGCDGKDDTTEATADLPFHAAFSIKPLSMVCATTCGTDDTATYQLRSATADVAGMTCSTVLTGSAVQCSVLNTANATIAAGATVAVEVVNDDDDDCSTGDVECILYYTYPHSY